MQRRSSVDPTSEGRNPVMSSRHPKKLTEESASVGGSNPNRQSRRAVRGQQRARLGHRHAVAICDRGRQADARGHLGRSCPVTQPDG